MKTTSEIIAYLEGRQAELEKQDPRPRDVYVVAELLAYIKSGGEKVEQIPPMTTTPYVNTEPLYCYFEPSKPCSFRGNCIACTRFNHSTITTATNTGNNEQD